MTSPSPTTTNGAPSQHEVHLLPVPTGVIAVEVQPRLPNSEHLPREWKRAAGNAVVTRALAGGESQPRAGALLRQRPHTAGAVITGAFGTSSDLAPVIEALVEHARERAHPLIKWEVVDGQDADPASHGFRPLRSPHRSGEGTDASVAGWVRDLVEWPREELTYYRQTTEFTCGGVSALLALEAVGVSLLGDDPDENRLTELGVWRTATNVPACDPLALTATVQRLAEGRRVEVHLDVDDAVLLEHVTDPDERAFRADLQRLAARELEAAGVPRHRDRPSMVQLAEAVEKGAVALLLIDLEPLIDDPTPHWVVASTARDGVMLIDDPWVETTIGETWVTTHEMPIAAEGLEGIVRWGTGYRGVILLHR